MNLLLNTHIFIWSYDEQNKLSKSAFQAMSDNSSFGLLIQHQLKLIGKN